MDSTGHLLKIICTDQTLGDPGDILCTKLTTGTFDTAIEPLKYYFSENRSMGQNMTCS